MTPLLIIAGLGAVALSVSKLARRLVPEIVIFLALGVLIGPQGPLGLINATNIEALNLVTVVALGAVIFTLGDRLRFDRLRDSLGSVLPLNIVQLVAASALVFAAVTAAGAELRLAIILALIAAETGVLTVTATIMEQRARGPFTDLLLSSVGVTNAAVATLFGLTFPFILAVEGGGTLTESVTSFAQIVVASTLIGLLAGRVLTRFGAGFETSGELMVFLLITLIGIAGLDLAAGGSVVVSALVAGVDVTNRAPWLAERLFAVVRTLEAPIYIVFFVVAGASIHLDQLGAAGLLGLAYVVPRTAGKVLGSIIGGWLSRPPLTTQRGLAMGVGMLPHAGMAIALVAFVIEQAPRLGVEVSTIVLGSIVLFELAGPVLTRRALRLTGERGQQPSGVDTATLPELKTSRDFNRVLVPIGNLRVVLPRLPFILDLVGNLNAELIAVHVSRPGSPDAKNGEPEVLKLVRRVAEERNVPVRTIHHVSEVVVSVLVDAVREEEADIVVMGDPVRGMRFEGRRRQPIAYHVMRRVHVPVLVYPVDPRHPADVPRVYLRRADAATSADEAAGIHSADEP